jgi:DNA repair exonuclease SbcCD nuclease subunit
MAVVKFLQVSDLHLGRPFGWLARERRIERRADQRRAVETAVKQAIERGVDAILLPGDLFDLECVDADTLAYAVHDAFDVPGCPPVFIAPGNHDPYSETSHYWNPALLRARGWAWPERVHVFTTAPWSSVPLPGREDVRVWGRCFVANVTSMERPLDEAALAGARAAIAGGNGHGPKLEVAVFHGSREGFCPPGQKITAPFSDAEALRSPFDYLAVGHYHTPSWLDGEGSTRLAYAGAPIALDVSEVGVHGACEVRITFGDGAPRADIEFLELDRRRVHDLTADVQGATSVEQVERRITRALDQVGAGDQDIVTVRLTGRITRGVRYLAPGAELRARVFHLRVDASRVRPDYDLAALRAEGSGTTEERFARTLLDRLDATTDPAERTNIEQALYYGLDAFRLQEVSPLLGEPAE